MISIIIPTLNEEKILEKTLTSLRELTDIPYEIIVSDGKSTDGTIEIAKKYADKVVVYEGEARQTIALARNMGAREAQGDILLFLDADMHIPEPNTFFPKVLTFFSTSPRLVGLTVYLKIFPEMIARGDVIVPWLFNSTVRISNNVFRRGASSGEFQMIRASAFKQIGGFNEKLVAGEDFDMFARLCKIGRTRSISSLSVFHTGRRVHKVGWPVLLHSWFMNWFHATFFNQSWSDVWEEVR